MLFAVKGFILKFLNDDVRKKCSIKINLMRHHAMKSFSPLIKLVK